MARIKDITIDGTLTGTERLVSTDADLSTKNITVNTLKQFILTGQGTALTFPSSTGSNGQILITNGSNVLDWGNGFSALATSGSQNAAAGNPGVATLSSGTLNVPDYSITLTTTGSTGAATLSSGTLNIPQYGGVPAGANTQIQFNNSGSFGAASTLAWDGSVLSATALTTTGVIKNAAIQLNTNKILPVGTAGIEAQTHKEVKAYADATVTLAAIHYDRTLYLTHNDATLALPNNTGAPLGTHIILSFSGGGTRNVTSTGNTAINGGTSANIAVAHHVPVHLINVAANTWVLG